MRFNLKFSGKQLVAIYTVLTVLAILFFLFTEFLSGQPYYFSLGGRDMKLSFYDLSLYLVFIVSTILMVISAMAYLKKKNERLFFVAFAFFLFTMKSALKIVENHIISSYSYIGISIQTLDLLILLSLFFALFKK